MQRLHAVEMAFDNSISALYLSVKDNQVEIEGFEEEVSATGKDRTAQLLVTLLNCTFTELMGININIAKRQLYTYHVDKAVAALRRQADINT